MEGAAGVAAARGGSLPMPSSARKEWRAVSEHHHHSVRNAADEGLERSKMGQSDERTIYEHGSEPADVDFCSITIDGGVDNDILQQQLNRVARQREELQQMEIELRVQAIVRSEIIEIRSSFDAQMKEHANAAAQLQEHLHERERSIHELERKIEEKDRELNAIKLEKEAAWAKEDLLIEQNKELANFRRERDHSEAERVQHIKQIHDFQEHIQEKDRQLNELQDQYRTAQEAILYKDEQLREAQAWVSRVQEMDVLQSSTNHSLQAELRERTEQYNQLWLGCQRQFAEMERIHLHTIQQLQLEMADARERNGTYTDESRTLIMKSKDGSPFGQDSGNQVDSNGASAINANAGVLPNGTSDNASVQNNHAPGVPIAPSSILGMHTYVPPAQATALHSFMMHHQGVPQSMQSHAPLSHSGHFQMASMSSVQQWQNQQQTVAADGSQLSVHSQLPASQNDQSLVSSDGNYAYEIPVNGQATGPQYHDQASQGPELGSIVSSTEKQQVLESIDSSAVQPEQSMQQISSQFQEALSLSSQEQRIESKDGQVLTEQASSASSVSQPDTSEKSFNADETAINNGTGSLAPDAVVSTVSDAMMGGKQSEITLLDERSLLACIVRTIPPGGRIRISSTLPNRLGKMLSPLHWHDYKKKYGKLDDFVASHPELFVIEGDSIQLQEGAQKMIAATAAAAKVAAAASATTPSSKFLPSVAVTPMAQPNRLRKLPSVDSADASQPSVVQNQLPNGVHFGATRGVSNVKILSKTKDSELNGANYDRSSTTSTESRGSSHGRSNAGFVGKQPGRTATMTSRR